MRLSIMWGCTSYGFCDRKWRRHVKKKKGKMSQLSLFLLSSTTTVVIHHFPWIVDALYCCVHDVVCRQSYVDEEKRSVSCVMCVYYNVCSIPFFNYVIIIINNNNTVWLKKNTYKLVLLTTTTTTTTTTIIISSSFYYYIIHRHIIIYHPPMMLKSGPSQCQHVSLWPESKWIVEARLVELGNIQCVSSTCMATAHAISIGMLSSWRRLPKVKG